MTLFFKRVALEKMPPYGRQVSEVPLQLGVVLRPRTVCLGKELCMMGNGRFDGWPHIIYSQQFSREWLEKMMFPMARSMRLIFQKGGDQFLKGRRMVTLFYRPSTRTRGSFQMAMSYQGGEVAFATENAEKFSSAEKGESLEHATKVWCGYRPDVIVLRHYEEGAAERATRVSSVPIINAGDGPGQHPTQALLDIYTIQERLGRIDDISIAIVGDLKNGRTARSLAYLLAKFDGVRIHFVSPETQKMKKDVLSHLEEKKVSFTEDDDLAPVLQMADPDVIYMLRTQREHGSVVYDLTDRFVLNGEKARLAKKTAIFMHPLPIDSRVKEVRPEIEADPRSVFLTDQIESGLFVRMALLRMILAVPQKRWFGNRFGMWLADRRSRKVIVQG